MYRFIVCFLSIIMLNITSVLVLVSLFGYYKMKPYFFLALPEHLLMSWYFISLFMFLNLKVQNNALQCVGSSSEYQYFFQDYHWWWRSFLTSGFTAFYLFVYCIHYFVTKLNIEDTTSTFLYFGYTLIMVFLFFLLTGKLLLLACCIVPFTWECLHLIHLQHIAHRQRSGFPLCQKPWKLRVLITIL